MSVPHVYTVDWIWVKNHCYSCYSLLNIFNQSRNVKKRSSSHAWKPVTSFFHTATRYKDCSNPMANTVHSKREIHHPRLILTFNSWVTMSKARFQQKNRLTQKLVGHWTIVVSASVVSQNVLRIQRGLKLIDMLSFNDQSGCRQKAYSATSRHFFSEASRQREICLFPSMF